MFRSFRFCLIFLTILVLSACSSATATPEPTATTEATPEVTEASATAVDDTLRIFMWQAPTTLNPHTTTGQKDYTIARITYEPLASFDSEGNMIPFLASEIPSLENAGVPEDGRSVTWTLKENVFWSDGEPFTADDVVFTYEYITNPDVNSTSKDSYKDVESVVAVDDHTIRVEFKDINPSWTLPFVGTRGMILPRHIFGAYAGTNFADAPANLMPIGTGPYRVTNFAIDNILIIGDDIVNTIYIIFERNPFYRDPAKPYFSGIEVHGGGGDANFAADALRAGLTDYAWTLQVSEDVLNELETDSGIQVVVAPGARTERLFINFTDPNRESDDGQRSSIQFPHPFFSDPAVRQALTYAIDREIIVGLYGRTASLTSNILVSPSLYDSPNTSFEYNPEKAIEILEEAGWVDSDKDGIRDKDDISLSVVHQTTINPIRQQIQEILRDNLEAIGFEVTLNSYDASIFFGAPSDDTVNTNGQFYADLEQYSYDNKSPDPGAHMSLYTCNQRAQRENNWSTFNDGRYCNPQYDEIYLQSTTEIDPDKRRDLIIQLNDLLVNDVAMIPLAHILNVAGISDSLLGFAPSTWEVDTWNIADWRRK